MHLREHGEDEPHYVLFPYEESDMFTVKVIHDGIFCGFGGDLDYVTASTLDFDYLSAATWSLSGVDEILRILGCSRDGRLDVYWLMPGRDFLNGLMLVETQAAIRLMINASKSNKVLVMFIDHSGFIKMWRPNIIQMPTAPPSQGTIAQNAGANADRPTENVQRPVVNVQSPAQSIQGQASSSSSIIMQSAQPEASSSRQAVESDSGSDDECVVYDSDYNVESGDDNLFAENIDKSVNDFNEKEICDQNEDEDALEDDDLDVARSEMLMLKNKVKVFNAEVDMDNPIFMNGMRFSCFEELRKALTTYNIRNRKKIKKTKNDQRRLEAKCVEGCTWYLKSGRDARRTGGFMITSYEGKHTCETGWPVEAITSKILVEKFIHEFMDNPKLGLQSFALKVVREFKMCPPIWKLSRARASALLQIHGVEEEQFNLLLDYGQELRRSNPGSKFFLTTNSVGDPDSPEHKEHLDTIYWSYDACKRGFLAGCRPLICLDGCHIKTRYKGVLLTAVGIDPNDCIYPIAFGLCEVECTSSWEWFLTNLRDDLNITNTSPWTIMSDRQKGLINFVEKVWPDAEHRFCVRRLIQNFQREGHRGESLKNDIWAIARSTCVPKWKRSLDKLKADSQQAFEWTEELVPSTWIKDFFSEFPKCDMLLNNHSEMFNSYILEARQMPILSMLETLFYKILRRTKSKQREAEKMIGRICPKIKKKMDKFTEWSNECGVKPAGNYLYSVSSHEPEKNYSVDFKARTCDCKRWQLSGIPCHHVIACCGKDNINPENLVQSCYTVDTFNRAYAFNLVPVRGRQFWEKMNAQPIHPPFFTKVMGRPKKNRKKAPEEKIKKGVKVFTKAGVTMHCSICGKPNHNKKGHQKYLDSLAEQIQNNIIHEEEEIDIPSILEHVVPHSPNPLLDPTNQVDSMVHMMQEEEREHVPMSRLLGPLPENAFVVAARDSILERRERITTASSRGNLMREAEGEAMQEEGRGRQQQK